MFGTKKSRLVTGLAAVACVCCVGGVSAQYAATSFDVSPVGAETSAVQSETPAVYIESKNVSYSDSLYILYAVSHEGFDSEQNAIKMLFWNEPQTDYTVENAVGVTTKYVETVNGKECEVFYSEGIAAKEMTDVIYCRAYVELEGEIYYSDVEKYSVMDYVYTMREEGNLSGEQQETFTAMLDYGAAAQKLFAYNTDRLANANFYKVSVEGGVLSDGTTMGRYVEGSTVTLTAAPMQGEDPFVRWITSKGEVVGEETSATVTVSADETYIAKYDEEIPDDTPSVSLTAIQEIMMTNSATYSINLGTYANDTISSIMLGDYNLGTNPAALAIGDDLKADTQMHGGQTILVNAYSATLGEYVLKVPVTIITKTIGTLAELQAIQPTEANPAVYGYYVMTANITNTTLAASSYVDPNWSGTSGFFGTLDGAGYYIQMAQNGVTGLFGAMRSATLKNITIKDQWSVNWNGARLLGAAAYDCTFENVEIVCLGGGSPNMNVGNGSGYLFSAEFSNNVVRNMTITVHTSGQGNVFGGKFYGNTFENVVVNGTYTELAYCPEITDADGNVVYAEKTYKTPADVEASVVETVVFEQQIIDMSKAESVDLKEYADATLVDISASNGAKINGLTAEFLPTDKSQHGELTLTVTVLNEKNERVILTIPVILATQTLSTMQELYDVVKMKSGVSVGGYYLLTADVSDTEAGFTVGSPASYEWQSGTSGFCGTLIGATKADGSKYTVSFGGGNLKHGLFTTIRNATVKNIKLVNTAHNDAWNNSIIGYTAFNTTFEDVDIDVISTKISSNYGMLVGSHMGGCTWKNVTVKSMQAHGIIFKVINDANNVDTFENFTVKVLSLEKFSNTVADAPAGVTIEEGIVETVTEVTFEQQIVDMSKAESVDLKEYANGTLVSISADNGMQLNGVTSEFLPTDYSKHGEVTLTVTVLASLDERVIITIPVILATKTISTMQEFNETLTFGSGDPSIYGYYVLMDDIDGTSYMPMKLGGVSWSSGNAAKWTLDGRNHTVKFNIAQWSNAGLFGTLNGATIKNVNFFNAWQTANYATLAYNAYNTVLENVTIKINGGNPCKAENGCTPIFAFACDTVSMMDVTIDTNVAFPVMFGNVVKSQFTNVVINGDVAAFAVAASGADAATWPEGITINNPQA